MSDVAARSPIGRGGGGDLLGFARDASVTVLLTDFIFAQNCGERRESSDSTYTA